MLYFSVCFTLAILLASLHLLIKIKKEGLGNPMKWATYLIMLAATVILLCQLVRGVVMMRHHFREPAGMGCYDGMRGCGMMHNRDMDCCRGMGCCGDRCDDDKKCDDGKMKCDKDTASCCKGGKHMDMDERKEKPEMPEKPEKKEKAEKK